MKLLTLNCHSWQEENQIDKIKYIAKVIKQKKYDVIALQEVSQSINKGIVYKNIKEDNFALLLLDELKKLTVDEYSLNWDFSHIGYDIYEEGVAILTKHPVIENTSFFVTNSNDTNFWKTRKILKSTIDYKGKNISFFSCHLGWWDDKEEPFKSQVDNLINQAKQENLFFLMGDFNNDAHTKGEGYDYLIKKGLYDTYNIAKIKDDGITVKGKIAGWEKNKQGLRIDMIFVNKPVNIDYSKVIFNGENGEVVSDHFGVEIQVNI
ncbi:maltose 6'-phosphate phosphatase [Alkalithermobacter thermoalcaliphilus JW-YL-7 = DSM 7308]|uniref:Endonuclease/exonuclease/phosphatase n=1 Tax=Alkalithermobacter thermoalcaliphilus JW-YL-7 = DSM 7308 TaxID=1121328 RepID=A0A150FS40_CLOPD|nr:Endonuclease/exonuclease/phosphatase [[Clostridium] paradoxum JW-YL-7 = DSM 7308]SHK33255.1 maltose 6'-phosphate phosphatase [[Clostridium] paradoxum JW-YL-7 = DSM 7308]